jgi:hypothetical protein
VQNENSRLSRQQWQKIKVEKRMVELLSMRKDKFDYT